MTNHYDYYEAGKKIAKSLAQEGQKKWADLIVEKIEAESTATEILMGVRWAIQECLKSRANAMSPIDKEMLSLVARIDGALK